MSIFGAAALAYGASETTAAVITAVDWIAAPFVIGAGYSYYRKNRKKPDNLLQTKMAGTKKRKTTKKRSTRRTKQAFGSRLVKTMGAIYQPEVKHIDIAWSHTPGVNNTWSKMSQGTNGVMWLGCNPIQGTEWNQRIGRRIRIVKMELTMTALGVPANLPTIVEGNGFGMLFCDIWQDRQCNYSLAGITQIYDSQVLNFGNVTPTVPDYRSPDNTAFKKRFKRIARSAQTIQGILSPTAAADAASLNMGNVVKIIKRLNVLVNFGTGSPGTIAEVADNTFLMTMCWSGNVANPELTSGSNPLACVGGVRFEYVDA
nr:MAG: putative capsid protein [Arizlama virus]